MSGKFMGFLGFSCMNFSYEFGVGVLEVLYYLFKIFVFYRSKWYEFGWLCGCSCGDLGSKEVVGVECRFWVRDIRGWFFFVGALE